MKRVLITGATGMIGNIVLNHCLQSSEIHEVISIVRRRGILQNNKLKEIVQADFADYSSIENVFENIDIAYFCLGVYTGSVSEDQFKKITVDYTIIFADMLKAKSPNAVFCFLSGAGADRSEKSKISFARYKGIAENYLIKKSFSQLYIFRPGYIYPVEKRTEPNLTYRIFRKIYPLIKVFGRNFSITSVELGKVIFIAGLKGADKMTFENRDILNFTRSHLKNRF